MLPILFLTLMSNIGEPISPRIAAIDSKARLYPPKRSPWHGTTDGALKVTLWNGNGVGLPQKMKVDATLGGGGQARDVYWFQTGKVTYGTQSRFAGGEAIERRMTFATGKLAKVQERRALNEAGLGAAAFRDLPEGEVTKLGQSVATLLKECLKAPGLRDRRAMVKAVESDRVVFQAAPGVDAWVSRRQGDNVSPSLVGRNVTYDFTAVDLDGRETDYLNAIRPVGAAPVAAADPAEPVVKKPVARKAVRKKVRRKRQ